MHCSIAQEAVDDVESTACSFSHAWRHAAHHSPVVSRQLFQGDAIAKISDLQTKLDFYALYKQASAGDVRGERPGMFDMKGRAKVGQTIALAHSYTLAPPSALPAHGAARGCIR